MKHPTIILFVMGALALTVAPAMADHPDRFGPRSGDFHEGHQPFAPRGTVMTSIPRGGYEVHHGGGRYWYHGGNWYAPYGPRWTVIAPPFGVFVPILPGFYSTLWFGGVPYYYANDVYYVWRQEQHSYEVVPPPEGADGAPQAAPTDLYVYPRNGQTEAQQSEDRYQCHRWASDQTHFDPTRPGGGEVVNNVSIARAEYLRAMSACLEGRGYTAK